jgi:hypothetical protein
MNGRQYIKSVHRNQEGETFEKYPNYFSSLFDTQSENQDLLGPEEL